MTTGALLYSLHQHNGPIWQLKFDQFRLLSSAFDQTVLLWDFSAGNVGAVTVGEGTTPQPSSSMDVDEIDD